MKNLTIVIPAYNEEKRIGKTLEEYIQFFSEKLSNDFDIFIVLNGCRDNTLDVVKKFSRKYPNIDYINIKEAIGKGGAIIEGFKKADSNFIGFVDADGATPARAFYDLYINIGNNEGIIASRWIRGANIGKKQPISRRIASRIFNLWVRFLFGIKVRDSQCGAKLFTKDAVRKVQDGLGITRWGFDVDLLYLMKKNNLKIIEIPTEWNEPGGSKLNLKKISYEMFLSTIRLRLIYSKFIFIVKIYDRVFGNG